MPRKPTLKLRLILGLFSAILGLPGMMLFTHLYFFIAFYGDGLSNSYYVILNPESLYVPLVGYFFAGTLILPRLFSFREYRPGRAVTSGLFFFAFFLLAFNPFILQPDPLPYDVLGYDLAAPLSELGLGLLEPLLPETNNPLFGLGLFMIFTVVSAPVYGVLIWISYRTTYLLLQE